MEKKNQKLSRLLAIFLFLVGSGLGLNLSLLANTWTWGVGGNWNDIDGLAVNASDLSGFVSGDNITISHSTGPVSANLVGITSTIGTITFATGGTGTLSLPSSVTQIAKVDFTVAGILNTDANVIISDLVATTGTLTFTAGGTVTINSNATLSALGVTGSGTVKFIDASVAGNSKLTTGATTINTVGTVDLTGVNDVSLAATTVTSGILDLRNIPSVSITGTLLSATGQVRAEGASVTISAANTGATDVITTDNNTNLTLTTAAITWPTSITTLGNLNVGIATTLGTDLTVHGNYTSTAAFTIGSNTLTVHGSYTGVADVWTSSTIVLNGPILAWATAGDAAANLTIGGTGTISVNTALAGLLSLNMNRPAQTLTLGHALAIAASGTVTITQGTVKSATFALTNANANVGANGTLDISGANQAFSGTVAGTGKIIIAAAAARTCVFSGPYTFTGNLVTDGLTTLTFNTSVTDLNLNSSVKNLAALVIDNGRVVTLTSDLKVASNVTLTASGDGIILNGYTLEVGGTLGTVVGAFVDAKGSTLILNAAFTATATNLLTDAETNIFNKAGTLTLVQTDVNNLTLGGGGASVATLATNTTLERIHGNLIVLGNAANIANFTNNTNLTISGDVVCVTGAAAGTVDFTGATVTLGGQLGAGSTVATVGTITTTGATNFIVAGTGNVLQLPVGVAALASLKVLRPSGVRLNGALALSAPGASAPSLHLVSGTLDLNGYNATVAGHATNQAIKEEPGYYVINTGAYNVTTTRGALVYTMTAAASATEPVSSGIGIKSMSGGITAAASATIHRFPKIIPMDGIGLTVGRIYQISAYGTAASATHTVEFEYAQNEVYGTDEAGLDLYWGAAVGGGLPVYSYPKKANSTRTTSTTITLGSVKVTLPATAGDLNSNGGTKLYPANADIFVITGLPSAGGVLKTFANTTGDGLWNTPGNWAPVGVPTKSDQVYISNDIKIAGNGNTFYAQSVVIDNTATVSPNVTVGGDIVNLVVLGDISITGMGGTVGVANRSKLNLSVGDGVTPNLSSTIAVPLVNNTSDRGLWVNDFTINNASVTLPSGGSILVNGNFAAKGASLFEAASADVVFTGANASVGNIINIASTSAVNFGNLALIEAAKATTSSNFSIAKTLIVPQFCTFTATAPSVVNFTEASTIPWNVAPEGNLVLSAVDLVTATGSSAPVGDATLTGTFTVLGANAFNAAANHATITMGAPTGVAEIINATTGASADNFNFWNLIIAPSTKATTSSSFVIKNSIDVRQNASLVADNGTIYTGGALSITGSNDPVTISNASDHTLVFNDITMNENTVTSTNWKVAGHMTLANLKYFTADNGTVTFSNYAEKKITAGTGVYTFFGLEIADGARVLLDADYIKISNNNINKDGAGFFARGTGQFGVADPTNKVIFDSDNMITETGHPKTIVTGGTNTVQFGVLEIAATANNAVTTESSFIIRAQNHATNFPFVARGAGASFNATSGTIEFCNVDNTAANYTIASLSPASTVFNNILAGSTVNNARIRVNAGDEIFVRGDITVNDVAEFYAVADGSKVVMVGNATQTLGGTSLTANPIRFINLQVNKSNSSDRVILGNNVSITGTGVTPTTSLILTKGILDLGQSTLTVGSPAASGLVSRHDGVIDGNKGTYVVATNHMTPMLEDQFFMVDGEATLYNLTIQAAHTTANTLTVNGLLNLETGIFTVGAGASAQNPIKLVLNGDLTTNGGKMTGNATNSLLVLQGTGVTTPGLSNSYYSASTAYPLEVARQESLGGNLTMTSNSALRMNSGVNTLVLGNNTLKLDAVGGIVMVSGTIDAGNLSTVDFVTLPEIPANIFLRGECGTLVTTATNLTLRGNVRINNTFNAPSNIVVKTDENILTFGPTMVITNPFTTGYIFGNLKRTVTQTLPIEFKIGNKAAGGAVPVTLRLASAGNSQEILVSANAENPTYARGGNPENAVAATWFIIPDDLSMRDSVKVDFGAFTAAPAANVTFPARWNEQALSWDDYRNNITPVPNSGTSLTMTGYPVTSLANLAGAWAIFHADSATNTAKDRAIAVTMDKIMVVSIEPTPAIANRSFKATVQLQNRYGQPIVDTENIVVKLELKSIEGAGVFGSTPELTLPAGSTTLTFNGLAVSASGIYQILAKDTAVTTTTYQPAISEVFSVLDNAPNVAAKFTVPAFSNVTSTSLTVSWTTGILNEKSILVAKAINPIDSDEDTPENSITYVPNTIFGAGSNIGNAVVLASTSVTAAAGAMVSANVTGLLPNTQYYFYVYNYTGGEGYQSYKASLPAVVTTAGTIDDDVAFGINNTRNLSKTIGTNAPVTGTIKVEGDEDWFNFMVTNAAPNLRVKLQGSTSVNLAGDYTIEIYDFTGRRIRRSTLNGLVSEAQVANNLPAGTYTVHIFATDSSFYKKTGDEYKLIVNTFGKEIFAVTP